MNIGNQKKVLQTMLSITNFDCDIPIEKVRILQRSGLLPIEFEKCMNVLKGKGFIEKYQFTRVNDGDVSILPESYIIKSLALNFLEDGDDTHNNTTNYNTINAEKIIDSNIAMGSNVITINTVNEISQLLKDIESNLSKTHPSERRGYITCNSKG